MQFSWSRRHRLGKGHRARRNTPEVEARARVIL